MKLFDTLTNKNFTAFAQKHYDDPQCETIEDFEEDLRRFRYLKRLLHRYHENGEMRERLMLNHIITIFNVFGFEASMKMLEFKLKDEKYWMSVKTMLLYLGYIDESWSPEMPLDDALVQRLRDL